MFIHTTLIFWDRFLGCSSDQQSWSFTSGCHCDWREYGTHVITDVITIQFQGCSAGRRHAGVLKAHTRRSLDRRQIDGDMHIEREIDLCISADRCLSIYLYLSISKNIHMSMNHLSIYLREI